MEEKAEKLMSVRLHLVALRLVSAHHVRSLGLQLGVADYTIDAALYNHRWDIQEAGYTVLKAFFQGQDSRTEAYARLQRALRRVGLPRSIDVIEDFDFLVKQCEENVTNWVLPYIRENTCQSDKSQQIRKNLLVIHSEKEDTLLAEVYKIDTDVLRGKTKTKSPLSKVGLCTSLQVLHDYMVKLLSMKLDEEDIYRLASRLDIPLKDIESSFAKFCTKKKAAIYDILNTWVKRHSSRREVYVKLGKALIHPDVGLNLVAREVLRYPLTEPDSLITNCPKLKDRHLRKASRRLSKEEMYLLGQKLGISSRQMDASFMKFCTSEKDAILHILSRRLKGQNSREEAYLVLGDAMIHPDVRLNLIAKEVLGYSK